MRTAFMLLLGLIPLTACNDAFSGSEQRDLAEARAQWDDAMVRRYQMEVRVGCFFCSASLPVFTRIEVRGDAVVSAQQVDSLPVPIDEIPLDAWPTVADAFNLILDVARQDEIERIDVRYDPVYGYPTSIHWGCGSGVLDCGAVYELRNLVPLDPHAPP